MSEAADHEIRPLRREDAPAWRALRLEMLKDSPGSFTADREDAAARSDAEWETLMPTGSGPNERFGLFLEGRLVGSAGFFVERGRKLRHRGVLVGVYVTPAARGRGFGEALVRRVVEHARGHVDVLLTGGSAAGAPLYRRIGFEPYGFLRDAIRVGGASHDEELLAIRFEPAS